MAQQRSATAAQASVKEEPVFAEAPAFTCKAEEDGEELPGAYADDNVVVVEEHLNPEESVSR